MWIGKAQCFAESGVRTVIYLVSDRSKTEIHPVPLFRFVCQHETVAVRTERSCEVAHNHVSVAVADEQDAELSEHPLQEPRGPSVA